MELMRDFKEDGLSSTYPALQGRQLTGHLVNMSIDQTSGHYWLLIVISGRLVN